jgi:hypothetical protein
MSLASKLVSLNEAPPFSRAAISIVVAGMLTLTVAYFETSLAPAIKTEKAPLTLKILSIVGSAAPVTPPAAPSPPPSVIKPTTTASAPLAVNAKVEHASTHPDQVTAVETPSTPQPATDNATPVPDASTAATPLNSLAQPALPIQAPPTDLPPVEASKPETTSADSTAPSTPDAMDMLSKMFPSKRGLILHILADSNGHAVQIIKEQSGGDPVRDTVIIEQVKRQVIQMNPPIPAGQQRWGDYLFDYGAVDSSSGVVP